MFKKIKDFLYDRKELLITLTAMITFFVVFFVLIIKKPFILNNDQWFQYNVFARKWVNSVLGIIRGEGLPFYAWDSYLGLDFYSSMAYYSSGDIFLPLLILFRSNIELGLVVETILCVYISAILMSVFLENCGEKRKDIIALISVVFALCGEASVYFGSYMFTRFYTFVPLFFIGLQRYFKCNRRGLFIIATAILFLQNYYFVFPTMIFLLIYCISWEIKQKKLFKEIWKDFLNLLVAVVIGFMISAALSVPAIVYLLNNSRVGVNEYDGLFWQGNVYCGLYMTLTTMSPVDIWGNLFSTGNEVHDNWYGLNITILPFIACIDYLLKKENKVDLITFVVLVLIMVIKPINSIMHGFSIPSLRWLFLFNFYILELAAKGMESLSKKKSVIIYAVYTIVFVLLLQYLYEAEYLTMERNMMHVNIMCVSLIINLVIFVLYNIRKNLAYILTFAEIVCFQSYYFMHQSEGAYNAEDTITKEEFEYYDQFDEEQAYRYYLNYENNNPDSILNLNKSLDYGMMSTMTYNSFIDPAIEKFDEYADCVVAVDWALLSDNPYANTMLGVKYYIVYKEDELPEELHFEYSHPLNYLSVYENLDYHGFGFTAENLKHLNEMTDLSELNDCIFVDDENYDLSSYDNLESKPLNILFRNANCLSAEIELTEKNILLIPIPDNKGWAITVNGIKTDTVSVNGGFIGIELDAGYNRIDMKFVSPGFKTGTIMTIVGLMALGYIVIDERKREKK